MKMLLKLFLCYFIIPLLSTEALGMCKNSDTKKRTPLPVDNRLEGTDTTDKDREIPETEDPEFQNPIKWRFATQNKIYASLVMEDGIIYAGSDDGNFYALKAQDGVLLWKYNTNHPIRATAAIDGMIVCFQSGNTLYALNRLSGDLIWEHIPENAKDKTPIVSKDDWDYHHCSPVIHENRIYYGNDFGYFYGLELETGSEILQYETGQGSPIRATATISDHVIYWGDFEGYIYAINLEDYSPLWTKRTYENKEYEQFGGIVSKMKSDKNFLYFGARNYNFQVLDKLTGDLVWKYTNASGGWVSGTPLIKDGKVYVGGSDTKSLHIFEASSGLELKVIRFKNGGAMFSEPISFDNYIIVQTGDAYNENGKGYLYIIREEDGSVVKELKINGSIFSTSLYHNNTVYIGSTDHSIYSVDLDKLIYSSK